MVHLAYKSVLDNDILEFKVVKCGGRLYTRNLLSTCCVRHCVKVKGRAGGLVVQLVKVLRLGSLKGQFTGRAKVI